MRDFTKESQVIAFLEATLKKIPGPLYWHKFSLRYVSGFPDLLVCYRERVTFYEVKVFRKNFVHSLNQFEPLQHATLSRIAAAGIGAYGLVVKNRSEAWICQPNGSSWTTFNVNCFEKRLSLHPLEPWLGLEDPALL